MPGYFRRFHPKPCSLCGESMPTASLVVTARNIDGALRVAYRLCWSCGYEVLRQLRMRPAGKLMESS